MAVTSTPAENTPGTQQIEAPQASAADEAEIRALLVEQGAIPDDGGESTAEPDAEPAAEAAEGEEGVFDDPDEAAAAAEMAAESGESEGEEAPADKAEEKAAASETTEEQPDPNAPSIARGLQSLARKENQLNIREKQISVREKELASKATELDTRLRQAVQDPYAFFKAMGVNPADVAAIMYFQEHPQGAPPEVAAKMQTLAMQREIDEMKREKTEQSRRQQAVAVRTNALTYLESVAKTIPDELPYLKAEAAEDVRGTAALMLNRLDQLRESGQLDDVVGDEEIAAKVAKSLNDDIEKHVKRVQRLHAKAGNGTTIVKPTAQTKPTAKPVVAKNPAPVAGEKKTAPKTINKKATAVIRPPRESNSHQEDIDKVIASIKAGNMQM